jgi:hypothetical protein
VYVTFKTACVLFGAKLPAMAKDDATNADSAIRETNLILHSNRDIIYCIPKIKNEPTSFKLSLNIS